MWVVAVLRARKTSGILEHTVLQDLLGPGHGRFRPHTAWWSLMSWPATARIRLGQLAGILQASPALKRVANGNSGWKACATQARNSAG